jgi:hypothetical protein
MKYPPFKQIFGPVSIAEAELQRILDTLIKKGGPFLAMPAHDCLSCGRKSINGPGQSQSYLDKAPVRISGRNEIFLARMMEPRGTITGANISHIP